MAFWLPALVILLICITLLGVSLRARDEQQPAAQELSTQKTFYLQQMAELEADKKTGKITEEAFAAAKVELAREFLRLSKEIAIPQKETSTNYFISVVPLVLVIAISLGAYQFLGAPSLPNAPLAERIAAGENLDIEKAITFIEQHLKNTPDDLQGWRVVAPIYMRMGAFEKAVTAFARIVELENETADNLTDLAEALMSQKGDADAGIVALLTRATHLDANHIRSRFYLAAEAMRGENYADAQKRWRELLDMASGEEPWVVTARNGLDIASKALNGENIEPAGPTADDVQNAANMSQDDRQAMIVQMVEGLDKRLMEKGGTPAEWAQLLRAQLVLGRREAAAKTLERARGQLADDKAGLLAFEQVAAEQINQLEGE